MAAPRLTFNTGQTAILMADFHIEGMGDNPMVRERGTVHKARAVLEAARQAGVEDGCADRDAEMHTFLTQRLFPRQATVASAEAVIQALSST